MIKKLISILLLSLLIQTQVLADTIPAGTVFFIRNDYEIDADDIKLGQSVDFVLNQNVKINGKTVVKAGTVVKANVIKNKNNGILGIPGEIQLGNFAVITKNGEMINLRGQVGNKGENRAWANIGWFLLWPILFVKGGDGIIPAGSTFTMYSVEDVSL